MKIKKLNYQEIIKFFPKKHPYLQLWKVNKKIKLQNSNKLKKEKNPKIFLILASCMLPKKKKEDWQITKWLKLQVLWKCV